MAKRTAKLKRAGRRSRYRLPKQTVEPVIGEIKQARGFCQFLLRAFAKVSHEWTLRFGERPLAAQTADGVETLS
jgi:hypothetical protein